jgi:hypothetical protein
LALLEFLSPTERSPIMLTKANEKIPIASATSVSVKPAVPERPESCKRAGVGPRRAEPCSCRVRGGGKLLGDTLEDMASEVV